MAALLRESGVEFEAVDYTVSPIPRSKLEELVRKLGLAPRELLRTRAKPYKDLGLNRPDVSDAAILDAMAAHSELVQRPIVERGERAVVARPPERVRELL